MAPFRVLALLSVPLLAAASGVELPDEAFEGECAPGEACNDEGVSLRQMRGGQVHEAVVAHTATGTNSNLDSGAFARGSPARGLEFWDNVSMLELPVAGSSMHGHQWLATTTQYADTSIASCGALDTAALVAGTDYYAVASAEAMQSLFPGGECCWCGHADVRATGHGSGTAPMGCSHCARGRWIHKLPYNAPMQNSPGLFDRDVNIVVADICPHVGNEAWCPQKPGSKNVFGSKNHFDFAHPPPGFDNYYFAFSPAPCSETIKQRLAKSSSCR